MLIWPLETVGAWVIVMRFANILQVFIYICGDFWFGFTGFPGSIRYIGAYWVSFCFQSFRLSATCQVLHVPHSVFLSFFFFLLLVITVFEFCNGIGSLLSLVLVFFFLKKVQSLDGAGNGAIAWYWAAAPMLCCENSLTFIEGVSQVLAQMLCINIFH